jgi:hypothetical protein
MLNEGNRIHNFISSSGSGSVINYGSGSDFLTNYGSGSGSTSQTVTVPTIPVPVPVPQHCQNHRKNYFLLRPVDEKNCRYTVYLQHLYINYL